MEDLKAMQIMAELVGHENANCTPLGAEEIAEKKAWLRRYAGSVGSRLALADAFGEKFEAAVRTGPAEELEFSEATSPSSSESSPSDQSPEQLSHPAEPGQPDTPSTAEQG
jgi:hypothetical protein